MKKTLFVLLLTTFTALAGKWTLVWDANPPADQVTQYEAFEVVGGSTNSLGIVSTNSILLTGVNPGAHTYQVVAIAASGIRSDPSTNGVFTYPIAPKNTRIGP